MINDKKILAVIPARGGSKGIPYKNIKIVENKPLIQYTIDAVKKSKYIDEIYVSTDDIKIKEVVEELGILVSRLRPKELASDESKTIDTVIDSIQYLKSIGREFDYVLLLQPTQPLRQPFHIDEALEQIIENKTDSLVSVNKVEENPVLMRTIDEKGFLTTILNENSTVRRQDFKRYYLVNGAIYINKINEGLNNETSLNDNLSPYIMEPTYCVDIDDEKDLSKFIFNLNLLKNEGVIY